MVTPSKDHYVKEKLCIYHIIYIVKNKFTLFSILPFFLSGPVYIASDGCSGADMRLLAGL